MSRRTTLLLGLGATGYSCVRHLAGRDALLAFDTRPAAPYREAVASRYPEVRLLAAAEWPAALAAADRLVASPGVALDHCLVRAAAQAGVPVSSDIELFLEACAAPVAGITGTNGKSTVTALVGELAKAAGKNAGVGGNLGTPALDLLAPERDLYVLELSSFQLERLVNPPPLHTAAVLNVSADHQDRHGDLAAYAAIKRRVYGKAERAVFNAEDSHTTPPAGLPAIAVGGDAAWRVGQRELVVDGAPLPTEALTLAGRHNHFNIVAAAAIAQQLGVPAREHLEVLAGFSGLPHRAARVAQIGGVAFVNDSKATNVGACQAALEGFGDGSRNIVLIAGGDAKGADFRPLAATVRQNVSALVLIGRDAGAIAAAVGDDVADIHAGSMAEAVAFAAATAKPGDTVLLAPACASFDMFRDYAARGDAFVAAVQALATAKACPGKTGVKR